MKVSSGIPKRPLSLTNLVLRGVLCFMIGAGNQTVFASSQVSGSEKNLVKVQKYFDQQKIQDQKILRDLVNERDVEKKISGLTQFIYQKAGTLAAYKKTILESEADAGSPEIQTALGEISRQADYYAGMLKDLSSISDQANLNDFADQLAQDSQSAFFFELFMIFALSFLLAAIFTPAYYYTYTPVTVIYDEKADKFYYYEGYRRVVYI